MGRNYTVNVPAGESRTIETDGNHTVIYTRSVSASCVIERLCADGQWRILAGGGDAMPHHSGELVTSIRVTALAEPVTARFYCTALPDATPDQRAYTDGGRLRVALQPELYDGNKALTVQTFAEKNGKTGTQYEAALPPVTLAAGASTWIAINVGGKRMVVKGIVVDFTGTELSQTLFRGGTYTGGAAIPIFNMNDQLAAPHDVTIFGGVTVSSNGAQVSPQVHTFGGEGLGGRQTSSIALDPGVERILWSNSTYLMRLTNHGTTECRVCGLATWFYGTLSPENPIDL